MAKPREEGFEQTAAITVAVCFGIKLFWKASHTQSRKGGEKSGANEKERGDNTWIRERGKKAEASYKAVPIQQDVREQEQTHRPSLGAQGV